MYNVPYNYLLKYLYIIYLKFMKISIYKTCTLYKSYNIKTNTFCTIRENFNLIKNLTI